MVEWEKEWREAEISHQRTMHELAVKKVCLTLSRCMFTSGCDDKECHERYLEPSLGHPGASQQLAELSTAEEARHTLCLDHTSSHSASLQVHCYETLSLDMYK